MTGICLCYGSIFEVSECEEDRMIPLKFHNLGEFLVVIFHMLINLDRLILAFRPKRAESRLTKCWFLGTFIGTIVLCAIYVEFAHHEDYRKSIAFGTIFMVNFLNLLIESKLYYYTSVVFFNTIGQIPLERRVELSSSVTMIRCFLPASACGVVLKFAVVTFYSLSYLLKDSSDLPPYYFVLNLFWNLDCALFPWFFLFFHPSWRQKITKFMKHPETSSEVSAYEDHFNQLKNVWKVGISNNK